MIFYLIILVFCNFLGFSSDLWSFGIIYFRTIAGHYPFEGEMTGRNCLFDKIKKNSIKFPLNFGSIDKHLVEQLCQKEPARRIPMSKVVKILSKYAH